jgi:hypothetical protein
VHEVDVERSRVACSLTQAIEGPPHLHVAGEPFEQLLVRLKQAAGVGEVGPVPVLGRPLAARRRA